MIILDASVALSWLISRSSPNEAITSQQALHAAMAHGALVPHLWIWEVMNGLLAAERHGGVTTQDGISFQADLDSLPISLDTVPLYSLRKKIFSFARTFQLTAYDATYIELAERVSAPLATFDRKLAKAARAAGIPVFGDPA